MVKRTHDGLYLSLIILLKTRHFSDQYAVSDIDRLMLSGFALSKRLIFFLKYLSFFVFSFSR